MNEQWDDAFCRVAISRRYLTPGQAEALLRDSADARDAALTFDFTEAAVLRGLLAQQHVDEVIQLLACEPTKGEVDVLAAALIQRGLAAPKLVQAIVDQWKFDRDLAGGSSPSLSQALIQASVATQQQIEVILAEMRPMGVPFAARGPALPPQAMFDAVTQVVHDPPARSFATPPPGPRAGAPAPTPPPTRTLSRAPTPRPVTRTATPRPISAPVPRPSGTRTGGNSRNPDVGRVLRVRHSMPGGPGVAIAGGSVLVIALIVYFVAKSGPPDASPSRPPQVASAPVEKDPVTRREPVYPVDPNREKPDQPPVDPTPRPPKEAPTPPPGPRAGAPGPTSPPRETTPPPKATVSPVFALLEQAVAMEDSDNVIEAARLLDQAADVAGLPDACRAAIGDERRRLPARAAAHREAQVGEMGGDLDAARKGYLAAFSCDAVATAVLAAASQGSVDQSVARQCLEARFRHLVRTAIEARADLRLVESLTAYDIALGLHKRMGMTCDTSGPQASHDELARKLRNLISDDGEASPEVAAGPNGDNGLLGPSPDPGPAPSPPVGADPPPAVDAPPSRDPAPPSDNDVVPGVADLPAEVRRQVDEMTTTMLSLWADRANPTNGLEEHRGEVLRLDLTLKRMKKEDRDRPSISFVEGVTHFLLARGVFEEFLTKRRAARTKPELKRVIDSYEPLYKKELSTAQAALKKARKAHDDHFAARLFEDLSRAWATDEWGAKKGTDDVQKDLGALRPMTGFDRELETYCLEGGLPKAK